MSYILRHRKLGPIGSTHWFPLNNTYVRGDIDSIEDPAGANTHTVLTAIPSPFARMHLFQTALEMVESNDSPAIDIKRTNHNGILSGGARKASKYHEMVSHCLDLWEIMFRFKNYQNGIKNQNNATLELIPYNLNDQLSGLERSYNDAHRLLGNTLRTFMTADKDSANFDLLTNSTLYLIVLNQVVIGCTSPLTFFFTPEDIAHNLQILHNITLKRSDTTNFFTFIVPLHKRDSDFQIYLHRFIAAYVKSNLSSRVKAFFDYTQKSLNYLQIIDIHLFTEIQNIYNSNYNQNQFDKEYVAVECNGNTLQVLGNVIKQKVGSEFNSDFVMDATKLRTEPTGKIPLILVRGVDFPNWKYYNKTLFTSQLKGTVPYADANLLATRTMPDIGITYPCLYVNDFLVPKLILLDEVNDGKHFFDGNTTTNQLEKFLLPIHENYFEYFTIQDLKSNVKIQRLNGMLDGKKQQYVKVTLTIPVINQRHVTLTKCYVDNPSADNRENVGTITSARINLAIFPFVKTSDGRFNDFYKIMLNSFSGESGECKLSFYNNYEQIPYNREATSGKRVYEHNRIPKNNAVGMVDNWTVRDSCFDYIKIETADGTEALIIPNWITKDVGNTQFSFAIDFGTTNTHVEIREHNKEPQSLAFTNTDNDCHVGLLGKSLIQDRYFIPSAISDKIGDGQIKFPTRTTTNEVIQLPQGQKLELMSTISICFTYEKKPNDLQSKIENNLKWEIKQNASENQARVTAVLEELLYLARTKIIIEGGNPATSRLVWFYPLSMSNYAKSRLQELWSKYYTKIFEPIAENRAISITESEAPYYYLEKTLGNLDRTSVLCIDIGGGTTDLVFFKDDIPNKATSVFFGANVLYGTGFVRINNTQTQNGLISKYHTSVLNQIDSMAEGSKKSDLKAIYNELKDKSSVDFINFLFTQDENIGFTEALRNDPKFKVLFLLYYGAIIYHSAQIMLLESIPCPQYICTSGNGSKILDILDPDVDGKRPELTKFTRCILEQFLHKDDVKTFDGIISEKRNPKEATCKGGIYCIDDNKTKRPTPFIIVGDENNAKPDTIYEQLTDMLKKSVITNVLKYIDKFIALSRSKEISYNDAFHIQINDYSFIKTEFTKNGITYLNNGLAQLRADDAKESLKETLFFYPFIGGIYELGRKIYQMPE